SLQDVNTQGTSGAASDTRGRYLRFNVPVFEYAESGTAERDPSESGSPAGHDVRRIVGAEDDTCQADDDGQENSDREEHPVDCRNPLLPQKDDRDCGEKRGGQKGVPTREAGG